jgi:hypothetical protein
MDRRPILDVVKWHITFKITVNEKKLVKLANAANK